MGRDLAHRFIDNPVIIPADVKASRPEFVVECLLNPGAFMYGGRVGLLLRVCERPAQEKGWISFPVLDPDAEGGTRIFRFRTDDPKLIASDPRVIIYDGETCLTTLSHLRLAWSDDGHRFQVEPAPTLAGEGLLESFGIEDCRVTFVDGQYVLTYSAVSPLGVGVGLATTRDWKQFTRHGMVISPANKDAAVFERKFGGDYLMLHRPSGVTIGGNFIWLARSPNLMHWGQHQCILRPRRGMWDSQRIGAGAAPIATARGWLEIYHGADSHSRYCLGALLLGLEDPALVLARSDRPIMEPLEKYETAGFFGQVVFTNGHIVRDDMVTVYYGAADSVICAAEFSIKEILATL